MKVAVIPARGGSKRIPRKNIKRFLGEPVLYYPIKYAKQIFDRVIVSTEDDEIAKAADYEGAEVYKRPPHLANDTTPAGEVVADCLKHFDAEIGACIYPTSVFAFPILLGMAIEMLSGADMVFSAGEFHHPIERAFVRRGDSVVMANPDNYEKRTQDLPVSYYDAGQFYVFKKEPFMKERRFVLPSTQMIVLPDNQFRDIDVPDDWRDAERLYENLFYS